MLSGVYAGVISESYPKHIQKPSTIPSNSEFPKLSHPVPTATETQAAELQAAVRLDAFGVRDRGGFAPTAAAERLRYRAAEALGVEATA